MLFLDIKKIKRLIKVCVRLVDGKSRLVGVNYISQTYKDCEQDSATWIGRFDIEEEITEKRYMFNIIRADEE